MNKKAKLCCHGHKLTPKNIYTRPNGEQQCRTCRNEAKKAYRQTPAGKATTTRNLMAWVKRQGMA